MKYLVEAAFYCTVVVEANDDAEAQAIVSSVDSLSLLKSCVSIEVEVLNQIKEGSVILPGKVFSRDDCNQSQQGLIEKR